jgi:PKD repeat protein
MTGRFKFKGTSLLLVALLVGGGLVAAAGPASAPGKAPPPVSDVAGPGAAAWPAGSPLGGPGSFATPRLPALLFEPNLGQAPPGVAFVARTHAGPMQFFDDGLALGDVRLRFAGHDAAGHVEGLDRLPSHAGYFAGGDAPMSIPDVPQFARLLYRGMYPGIDVTFHVADDGSPEFDYQIAPGADATLIHLVADGAAGEISSDGVLRFGGSDGISLQPPQATQGTLAIPVQFHRLADGSIGFALGAYDHARPLLIDPRLGYSSYFGGTALDVFTTMKARYEAPNWYVYVAGQSSGVPSGRCQPIADCTPLIRYNSYPLGGAMVAKFSLEVDGTPALVWIDNIAGLTPYDIDIDATGVYLVGAAINNIPISDNAYQTAPSRSPAACAGWTAPYDGVLTVLKPDGTGPPLYSTYIGGDAHDQAFTVVANAGKPIIGGESQWSSGRQFPAVGGFQTDHAGPPWIPGSICPTGFNVGGWDGFLAKFDIAATPNPAAPSAQGNPASLVWSTLLGGGTTGATMAVGNDFVNDLALDSAGDLYVTGYTSSAASSDPPFPSCSAGVTCPTPFQAANAGAAGTYDGFLMKVSGDGTKVLYNTFLGGTAEDAAHSMVLGTGPLAGTIILSGHEYSTSFPVGGGGFKTTNSGSADGFIAKFSIVTGATGGKLLGATLLGGTGTEYAYGLQQDGAGDIATEGTTSNGAAFPRLHAWPNLYGANTDLFVAKVSGDLMTLRYETALGGGLSDVLSFHSGAVVGNPGDPIARDIVVAGQTFSTDWPVTQSSSNPAVKLGALPVVSLPKSFHPTPSTIQEATLNRFIGPSQPFVACGPQAAAPFYRNTNIVFTWAPTGLHTQGIETYDGDPIAQPGYGMNIGSFQWDFDYNGVTFNPDPLANGMTMPSHSWPTGTALGAHTVAVEAMDTAGLLGLGTCTFTLSNRLPSCAGITPTSGPANSPISFSAVGTDLDGTIDPATTAVPAGYAWTFAAGSPTAGTGSPSTTTQWTSSGVKTVSLTVRDNDGGTGSCSTNVTITSNAAPTGNLDPAGVAVGTLATYHLASEDTAFSVPVAGAYPACGGLANLRSVLCNDSDDGLPNPPATMTAVLASGPTTAQGGTVSLQPNGRFTFTPKADFCGADSFQYKASDSALQSAATTVYLSVSCSPDPPTAVADGVAVGQDSNNVLGFFNLKANDFDVDDTYPGPPVTTEIDGARVVIDTPPSHALSFTPPSGTAGTFAYQPTVGYCGADSLRYHLLDAVTASASNVATLAINIICIAPTALDDNYVAYQGFTLDTKLYGRFPVLGNDHDVDNNPIVAVLDPACGPGPLGTLTMDATGNGHFTYTPPGAPSPPFNDAFWYRAKNSYNAQSACAKVTLLVRTDVPPVAAFSADPSSVLIGESTGITDRSSDADGFLVQWAWDFGDGQTAQQNYPSTPGSMRHGFAGAGTYTIRLTVTDDAGAVASVTHLVSVSDPPVQAPPSRQGPDRSGGDSGGQLPPTPDAGPDQSVAENAVVHLDGAADGVDPHQASFTWIQTAGPPVQLASATAAHTTFTAPGLGSEAPVLLVFQLKVSNGSGASAPDEIRVTVTSANHPPGATVTPRVSAAHPGDLVTLDGTATTDPDGQPLSFSWQQVDGPSVVLSGTIGSIASFVVPDAVGALVQVRFTASDGRLSASDTAAVQVVARPPAVVPFKWRESPAGNFEFETPLAGASYTWDFGDGSTGTGRAPTHAYGAPGTYNVTLAVGGAEAAAQSFGRDVVVAHVASRPVPAQPTGPVAAGFPLAWLLATLGVAVLAGGAAASAIIMSRRSKK